jgi:hypothetical protein
VELLDTAHRYRKARWAGPIDMAASLGSPACSSRWLQGWSLCLTYGVLVLVVAGTRLEPLRRDNPDFDLVGLGWLSVATLCRASGVPAVAGRRPGRAAQPSRPATGDLARRHRRPRPLLLLVLLAPVGLLAAIVGVVDGGRHSDPPGGVRAADSTPGRGEASGRG